MDERGSNQGFQPEVTTSARLTRPPFEATARIVNDDIAVSSTRSHDNPSANIPVVGVVSHANNPSHPVLVSAGTTDTATFRETNAVAGQ